MYKLLAIDVDGTLLNSVHQISEVNKEAIQRAKSLGVKIILLSGREPSSIKSFSDEMGINGLISGFNGGIIMDSELEKVYFNHCVEENLAKKTISLGERQDKFYGVFLEDKCLIKNKEDSRYNFFRNYITFPEREVGNVANYLDKHHLWNNIYKIVYASDNQELQIFKKELEKETDNQISSLFSLPFFLEVTSTRVSKGIALQQIAEYYGVSRQEVIAIGDGENDIAMLQYAGIGIAMGNAPDSVKKHADEVTYTNNENGVGHVIEKYLLS